MRIPEALRSVNEFSAVFIGAGAGLLIAALLLGIGHLLGI